MFCHEDQLTQAKAGKNPEFPLFIRLVLLRNHPPPFFLFSLVLLRNHKLQLEFQSVNAVDSVDIIDVDNLQSLVIIQNYSYILIQGTYLPAQDTIMTYLRLLHTCDSSHIYAATELFEQLRDNN
jgi:hypothetical protein